MASINIAEIGFVVFLVLGGVSRLRGRRVSCRAPGTAGAPVKTGRFFLQAVVGAAEAASSHSLPCEGRGGLGRGVVGLRANREHPLPTSPCLRKIGRASCRERVCQYV